MSLTILSIFENNIKRCGQLSRGLIRRRILLQNLRTSLWQEINQMWLNRNWFNWRFLRVICQAISTYWHRSYRKVMFLDILLFLRWHNCCERRLWIVLFVRTHQKHKLAKLIVIKIQIRFWLLGQQFCRGFGKRIFFESNNFLLVYVVAFVGFDLVKLARIQDLVFAVYCLQVVWKLRELIGSLPRPTLR